MSYDSDMRHLIKRAQGQGFKYGLTSNGHHQFIPPDKSKNIIHTAGTPGDRCGWNNFLSDMKRVGYVHREQDEDDAPTVQTKYSVPKIGVAALVRDYLKTRTPLTPFTGQEVYSVINAQRPEIETTSVAQTISDFVTRGEIIRISRGYYRVPGETQPDCESTPTTVAAPVFVPPPAPAPAPEPVAIAGTKTGDVGIDRDLEELDAALVALSRIETLVRRNREVLVKFAELKKVLGSLNLGGGT